jgi:ribonuclease P protein subunit RPR2
MPTAPGTVRRTGRRGRRNAAMLRVARERIATLFALAEEEAAQGRYPLSDRYVSLARRVGARYNVRLLPEYRELYCRGCSRYWVEGRTVRTRLRGGRRVRTCLACGRARRVPVHGRGAGPTGPPFGEGAGGDLVEPTTVTNEEGEDSDPESDGPPSEEE